VLIVGIKNKLIFKVAKYCKQRLLKNAGLYRRLERIVSN
jgi:hypothetical protein